MIKTCLSIVSISINRLIVGDGDDDKVSGSYKPSAVTRALHSWRCVYTARAGAADTSTSPH